MRRFDVKAHATIDRLEFGMNAGYPLISRDVDLVVASEFVGTLICGRFIFLHQSPRLSLTAQARMIGAGQPTRMLWRLAISSLTRVQ